MEVSKFIIDGNDVYVKDAEGRNLIAGLSDDVTTAQNTADGAQRAAEGAQNTADGAQRAAEGAQNTADDALNKISTIGLIESTTDISSRSLANGNYTRLDSITLPPGKYEIVAQIRVDNSYTDAIGVAINDTTPTSSEVCCQATTSTSRPTLVQDVKNVELSEETTINSYVLVYGSGFTCSNSMLSAFGVKEV